MADKMKDGSGKVAVENINHPGKATILDRIPYQAMKKAMLKVVPKRPPGMTPEEIYEAVLPHLPEKVFPGGSRAGWWAKSVQLDLEAKRIIRRGATRPLRLTRA